MKSLKVFLFSFILVLVMGFVVAAKEVTAVEVTEEVEAAVNLDENIQPEDLEVSEPRLLPDSPFYFLKNWARGIRMFFAFGPERKARLRLRFANEKILELKELAELKKDPKIIEKALESFQKELAEIEKAKVENLKQFSEKLIHQQLLHQKILERLEKQVPTEVLEKIKENRERHLERFAKVMEEVEEKFPEKLEEILEKQSGSEFKDFKILERLAGIEEKVSEEEAKEKIRERKEKVLEKFHKKLEEMSAEERETLKYYLEKIGGDKLRHLKILEGIMGEEISDQLKEKLEEMEERKIEEIEKLKMTAERAEAQIKKAEEEILKAEEAIKKIDPQEYRARAATRLIELAKDHLERAKKAFEEEKYGKAFGLATASYHQALNCQRIVEKIEEIKKSPEKLKEKLEELYPGVELPEEIRKCKLIAPPRCFEGEEVIYEKTPEGCPIFKCAPRPAPPAEEKRRPEACPALWDPVCGKDGQTYTNTCFAEMAGVEIAYKGVCKEEKMPETPVRPRENKFQME